MEAILSTIGSFLLTVLAYAFCIAAIIGMIGMVINALYCSLTGKWRYHP